MATGAQLQAVLDHIENQYYDQNAWRNGLSDADQRSVETAQLIPGAEVPDSLIDRLRQTHQDVFDPSTGQMTPGRHPIGGTSVSLPAPGPPLNPPPNIPGPGQGPVINTAAVHPIATHFDEMDHGEMAAHRKSPKSVNEEMVDEFKRGLDAMQNADDGEAPHGKGWGHRIVGIQSRLNASVTKLAGSEGFQGATGQALANNVQDSLKVLHEMGLHADAMGMLFDDFFRTLSTTKQFFTDNEPVYKAALGNGNDPPPNDDVLTQLNTLAEQVVSGTYNPPIQGIASRHPSVAQATPEVSATGPVTSASAPAAPSTLSAPASGRAPSGGAPAGLQQSPASVAPSTGKAPTDAVKGVTDAAKNAGNATKGLGAGLQNATGGLPNAAGQGLNALSGLGKGGASLPREGSLNLGPKGSRGLPKTGTGRGAGGGGGHGAARAKPAGQLPTPTKAASAAGTEAPVSRSGVSSTSGPGGTGAPAAGHANAAAKQHQTNKALRHTKNGEEVIGDVDSAAPVIGAAPRKSPPGKRT